MKWDELIIRIEELEKSSKGPLSIRRYITRSYTKISVFLGDVRYLDITSRQMTKLESLGYKTETIII
jgi:hypothetical protein